MRDVDLDELDARLRALGVDLDDPDPDQDDQELEVIDLAVRDVPELHLRDGVGVGEPVEPQEVACPRGVLERLGLDPVVDLPSPVAPPGYYLDARSVLRYSHDSVPVPGQVRVTLARRWRFPRTASVVLVPEVWVRTRPELAWVVNVAAPSSSATVGEGSVAAHPVPVEVWDAMASHCFAVTAPELTVGELLTPSEVAHVAGLAPGSVPTFAARGVLPEPTARVGGTPLWSAPVLAVWLANRRPPGRPPRRRRRR